MSRPRLDATDDTVTVHIRLPAELKARIALRADERTGGDLSRLVRAVMTKWLEARDEEDDAKRIARVEDEGGWE